MFVLSRLLAPRISRMTNAVVAIITIPLLLGGGIRDLDDGFFAAVTSVALLALAALAWKWKPQLEVSTSSPTLPRNSRI